MTEPEVVGTAHLHVHSKNRVTPMVCLSFNVPEWAEPIMLVKFSEHGWRPAQTLFAGEDTTPAMLTMRTRGGSEVFLEDSFDVYYDGPLTAPEGWMDAVKLTGEIAVLAGVRIATHTGWERNLPSLAATGKILCTTATVTIGPDFTGRNGNSRYVEL